MQHTEYICKGGHDYPDCMFCDGGLFSCTVCNGFEGTLSTDCPGSKMTEDQSNAIYAGTLDYREGRGWVAPDGTGKSMGDVIIHCQQAKAISEASERMTGATELEAFNERQGNRVDFNGKYY